MRVKYFTAVMVFLVLGSVPFLAQASEGGAASNLVVTVIEVPSMTCPHCAAPLQTQLNGVDGVMDVQISYEKRNIRINHQSTTSSESLLEAIRNIGHTAKLQSGEK